MLRLRKMTIYGAIFLVASSAIVGVVSAVPASLQAEAGTRAGNVSLVSDTTASGQSGIEFGAAPSSGTLFGWQLNATNVGLAPFGLTCASLPLYTGPATVPANTTISQKRIVDQLVLNAGNITIEKSCFQPTSIEAGLALITTTNNNICDSNGCQAALGPVYLRDNEFDGSLLSAYESAFTGSFVGVAAEISRNYVHHVGSGFAYMNTGKQVSAIVENNYTTNLTAYGDGATTGNHSDGFTIRDFDASQNPSRTIVVRNNRINCASGNDSGAFFIQTYAGDIDNVMITGNLLEGAGYNLVLGAGFGNGYSNISAINNRFTPTGWGAVSSDSAGGWAAFSENYRNDPTKTDNKGVVVQP